jgi:gas vesicle protein
MNFIEKFFPILNPASNPISALFVLLLILGFLATIFYTILRTRNIRKNLNEEALSDSDRFRVFWSGYKSTFSETLEGKKISNESSDIYINEHHFLYFGMNLRLISNVSNILIGFGILGTFVGLTYGIADSNFENTEAIKLSINQLLSGMGTAFVTSIWGMFLSIVFSLWFKMVQNNVSNEVMRFSMELDNKYLLRGEAKIRLEESRSRSNIESVIKDYFTIENEGGFLERPGVTLNNILKEAQSHTSSLNGLADDLALTLEETLEKLIESNTNQLTEIIEEKLIPILVELKNLKEDSGSEMIEGIIKRLEDSLKSMMSDFKETLSGDTQNELKELTLRLSSVSEVLVKLPFELDKMTDGVAVSMDLIKQMITEDIAKSTESANDQRKRSVEVFDSSLAGFEQMFNKMQKNANTILDVQNDNIKEVQRSIDSVKRILIDNSSINEQFRVIFTKAESVTDNLSEVSNHFEQNGQHLAVISNEFSTTVRGLSSYLERSTESQTDIINRLNTTTEAALNLSRDYAQKFGVIEGGLKSIFDQIQLGLTEYSDTTAATLNAQLLEFSSAFEGAINGLSDSAHQLKEGLGDMEEIVNSLKDE